jgi:hypothetical protein
MRVSPDETITQQPANWVRCSVSTDATTCLVMRVMSTQWPATAASILKCEQITTLHASDVRGQPLGAALSPSRILEVERGILRAIGIPVPVESD